MVLVLGITYIILYISCVIPTFVSRLYVMPWFIFLMNAILRTYYNTDAHRISICE
jgi:hypothetical protein